MALINTTTTGNYGTAYAGDSSGTLTIQKDGVTIAKVVDAPAFSAYLTSPQTVTGSTWTKVALNAKLFDTNNNFDSTSNYRFTPTVAGYYQFNGLLDTNGANQTAVSLKKNGNFFVHGTYVLSASGSYATTYRSVVSGLIYCNGSTDYVEMFGYTNLTSFFSDGAPGVGGSTCQLSGILIKAT